MTEPDKQTRTEAELEHPSEPSVLDWFKSLLRFKPLPIPEPKEKPAPRPGPVSPEKVDREGFTSPVRLGLPRASMLRLPLALLLGLIAQFGFELKSGAVWTSIACYLGAAGLIVWALVEGDVQLPWLPIARARAHIASFRPAYLIAAIVLSGFTFATSGDNLFDNLTLIPWLGSIVAIVLAFWEGPSPFAHALRRVKAWFSGGRYRIQITRWNVLVLLTFGVALFYRFARIDSLPPEMVSDHAEKLLDVVDVLNGRFSIFFPRNTGREALQFYMAAATARLLGTGISYLTLKIGTVFAGFITLPFIYLFAREVAGKRVGLTALVLAGIGYWPNVISRVGLRFPLYPLFVAPAMYFLARGARTRSRNDFLICGLVVGAGLHGYTPARVIPILVAVGVFLLILHREARNSRTAFLSYLMMAGLAALIVLMPLARVAVDRPEEIIYRMATRYGSTERPLPGPALQIFFSNVWAGLKMFNWDDGEVWVNSIPHRPALDWITGALFALGFVISLYRYLRKRHWIDLFVLISIPILQLPSTLSLAFPAENPATNRAAGAIIPAFTLAGMALAALPDWAERIWHNQRMRWVGATSAVVLVIGAMSLNYNLVFNEYADLYRRSAWNTSDGTGSRSTSTGWPKRQSTRRLSTT
ncbi:MAG: ArnT family glycosyltransferase [Anaerolineales bacterium]